MIDKDEAPAEYGRKTCLRCGKSITPEERDAVVCPQCSIDMSDLEWEALLRLCGESLE